MPLPLTVSCFSKIQIGFTFLVPAHLDSPGQRVVKRVCVYVCVCAHEEFLTSLNPSFIHFSRQNLETFYLSHTFLPVNVTKLSSLRNSLFWPTLYVFCSCSCLAVMHQCWGYCVCSLRQKYHIRIDTGDTFHVHSKKHNDDDVMVSAISVLLFVFDKAWRLMMLLLICY